MRSYRAPAVLLVAFAAASCGGDGGTNPPDNQPPAAEFANPACTGLACTFTDGSTDPDGNATIASWSWDFGGDGTSTTKSPAHTFPAAGAYDVKLTVTDDQGATDDVTHTVTVSGTPPVNQPPAAKFTFVCNAEECTFTNTSTDGDGTIASSSWDFDDGSPLSAEASPIHTYSVTALTTFNVTLTVTDDDGATNSVSKDVAVAPPAETTCEASPGNFVPCTLDLTEAATVKVTLLSVGCTASGNKLIILAPNQETVFTDGCSEIAGTEYPLNGGAAYTAGTQLEVQVISGSDDPNRIAPAIHVTGSYPEWTLNFDDGEDPSNPNEPDFDDLVLKVTATP